MHQQQQRSQSLKHLVRKKYIKRTANGKKDETHEMRTEEKPAEDTQKFETHVEEKTEEKPTATNIGRKRIIFY